MYSKTDILGLAPVSDFVPGAISDLSSINDCYSAADIKLCLSSNSSIGFPQILRLPFHFLFQFKLQFLFFLLSILLSSCIFSPESNTPNRTLPDLSQTENPLLSGSNPQNKNVSALAFAFISMDYEVEIASHLNRYRNSTGKQAYAAGPYLDITWESRSLRRILNALQTEGVTPYITLDPKNWDEPSQEKNRLILDQVIEGKWDGQLRSLAQSISSYGEKVVLRWAHEMNGDWYPYSGLFQGAGLDTNHNGQPDGPENYIRAWKHVHQIFNSTGASNVIWAFSPAMNSYPNQGWNDAFAYYPGNEYVDIILVDVYDKSNKQPQSLQSLLQPFINCMATFYDVRRNLGDSTLKSFGVGEMGCGSTNINQKRQWYSQALDYLREEKNIQFHALFNGKDKGIDFTIDSLQNALTEAYLRQDYSGKENRFLFGNWVESPVLAKMIARSSIQRDH